MRLSSDLQVEQDKDMRTRRWKRVHREASASPQDSCERRSASDHDESERPLHKESMQTVTHFRSASWGRFWMHAVGMSPGWIPFSSLKQSLREVPARTIIAQAQYRVCEGEQLLVYGTKLTKALNNTHASFSAVIKSSEREILVKSQITTDTTFSSLVGT